MNRSPRTTIALVGAIALTIGVAGPASAAAIPAPTHDEQITFQEWSSYGDWRAGTHDGTVALPVVGLTMLRPAGITEYADPHTGETPTGTWSQVELQGTYNTGDQTPWYVMGRWASGDGDIRRTSVNRQGDPWSTIFTDTFSIDDVANGVMLRGYQLRLTLYRAPGQW